MVQPVSEAANNRIIMGKYLGKVAKRLGCDIAISSSSGGGDKLRNHVQTWCNYNFPSSLARLGAQLKRVLL